MPMKPPRPCTKPGCAAYAVKQGRCTDHLRKGWHGRTGKTFRDNYGSKWRRIRKQILERDSFMCNVCKADGRYSEAKQVDHIVSKSEGGTDDFSNLQSICVKCHKKKTAMEGVKARMENKIA